MQKININSDAPSVRARRFTPVPKKAWPQRDSLQNVYVNSFYYVEVYKQDDLGTHKVQVCRTKSNSNGYIGAKEVIEICKRLDISLVTLPIRNTGNSVVFWVV